MFTCNIDTAEVLNVTLHVYFFGALVLHFLLFYRASAYLAMQSPVLATVGLSVRPSVCLSVCLFVCHMLALSQNDAS